MLNIAETIRFVVSHPSAQWPDLNEAERVRHLKRMQPFLDKWPKDLYEEFASNLSYKHVLIGDPAALRVRDALLKVADDIEKEDNAPKVAPRTFTTLKDKGTFSAKSMFPQVRAGGEDHKTIRTRGEKN